MERYKRTIQDLNDYTDIIERYSGKWIVLSKDEKEVICSGDSFDEIEEYVDDGIVYLVPRTDTNYTF
jgi:hypothetical protein